MTPEVPLTLEGAWALHQMFRVRRSQWLALPGGERVDVVAEATAVLATNEEPAATGHPSQSALFSMFGHKGDIMLLHFRDTAEELHRAELAISRLRLCEYLEPTHSYFSVVELGLYESSAKTYALLAERGLQPHSAEWNEGVAEVIARQSAAMSTRLYPEIPAGRFICFYPMDRKRAEDKNWYQLPMAERQRMMHEHGLIGRRYADSVRQIITGSIGFDDWEWGVDLFAEDPLVFKKLIYEMRFDEVSAIYALFGAFYIGMRTKVADLAKLMEGEMA